MKREELGALARVAGFHPIEGGAVVHDTVHAKLFALNVPAALAWLGLRHGLDDKAIAGDLSAHLAIDENLAADWVRQAMSSFDEIAAPGAEATNVAFAPLALVPADAPGTDYDFLGHIVRIDAPPDIVVLLDSLLGSLRRARRAGQSPAMAVSIRPLEQGDFHIISSAVPEATLRRDELAAHVEAMMLTQLVPHVPHLLAFHAALSSFGGRTVLLPGPSGVGKTTLSTVLATRGWRYTSDEMAMLSREGRWGGLPFPPCIKSTNYDRIGQILPGLAAVPEHERFGRRVKFAPVPSNRIDAAVATVVFPSYDASAATQLLPLESFEGLGLLLRHCIFAPPGLGDGGMDCLVGWHQHVRYFALRFADPVEAAQLLEEHIAGLGS